MINSLDTVKAHLKIDGDDETVLLTLYMQAAEKHIENLIDGGLPGQSDSPVEPIPFPIKAAHLLIVSDLYENRVGGTDIQIKENPAVMNLIGMYRNLGV